MIHYTIADDATSPYLRRRNFIHRFNVRRFEKNRFPVKCGCAICGGGFLCRGIEEYIRRQYYLGPDKNGTIRHVCWGCDLNNKVKLAAGTDFLPVTLHHRNGVDKLIQRNRWLTKRRRRPSEMCSDNHHRMGAVYHSRNAVDAETYPADFRAPQIPLWREEKMRLPGLGLSDRIGRLYKNSCWWPKRKKRRLFDKAEASSWKKLQLWKPGQRSFEWDPADADSIEKREVRQIRGEGGRVLVGPSGSWGEPFWLRSHKRHANLEATRESYNAEYGSYWNSSSINHRGRVDRFDGQFTVLSERLREQRSLNIPRETIDARNAMIANLERDFAPRNEARAA